MFIAIENVQSDTSRELTLWLIPAELVKEHWRADARTRSYDVDIDNFNKKYGKGQPLTVLNTTKPALSDQLGLWNPELGAVQWPMIASQEITLDSLRRFARETGIHLNVRFLSWGQAFEELRRLSQADRGTTAEPIPDVAQIGSTWVAYFADRNRLLALPNDTELQKRTLPGGIQMSVRFTTDIRFLFYWRRLPESLAKENSAECNIDSNTWSSMIASIDNCTPVDPRQYAPPLVVPIGFTLNLLHDFMPMIVGGGGTFIKTNIMGNVRADVASEPALKTFRLFAENATRGDRRLIAFPESTHQEIIPKFMQGAYRATIETPAFLRHWLNQSRSMRGESWDFWKHAGIALPPTVFKGGSDLVVLKGSNNPKFAIKLIQFLAKDDEYTTELAKLGYLPAHKTALGIDDFISALGGVEADQRTKFRSLVKRANEIGVEHPYLPEWPLEVESNETLEAMQRLARRLAEGNEDGHAYVRLRKAAMDVEHTLNYKLNAWTANWVNFKKVWPLIASIALIIAILYLRERRISYKNEKLALLLAKAKLHSQMHICASVMDDMSMTSPSVLSTELKKYSHGLVKEYYPHMRHLINSMGVEISRSRRLPIRLRRKANTKNDLKRFGSEQPISTVLDNAWRGARYEYFANSAKNPPPLKLQCESITSNSGSVQNSNVLTMILQEWFYNTFKEAKLQWVTLNISSNMTVTARCNDRLYCTEINIDSPVLMDFRHAAVLSKPPSSEERIVQRESGDGLPLIRDLLWYGFGVRAHVTTESGSTLTIPVPTKPRHLLLMQVQRPLSVLRKFIATGLRPSTT